MQILRGMGVSGGVAIGRARLLAPSKIDVTQAKIEDVAYEWERFWAARERAALELDGLYQACIDSVGTQEAEIFSVHAMIARDEDLGESVRRLIEDERMNAVSAVLRAADEHAAVFSQMEDEYMRERAVDVKDVAGRIARHLMGGGKEQDGQTVSSCHEGGEREVICAEDLTPAQTVELDRTRVCAFVTARGSSNSHTAILSRTMAIPAVVALGDGGYSAIREGMTVAVDAREGLVYLEPDEATLVGLRRRMEDERQAALLLEQYRQKESRTLDGRRVEICANVGSLSDVQLALDNGAEGIGLFRSEFLYIGRDRLPDEQEQLEVYRRVLESMPGRRVVVRTLDVGADKQSAALPLGQEENPALGLRAVRVSLRYPDVFLTQAKALLRASRYGHLCVMFPLITSQDEVVRLKRLWAQAQDELRARGEAFSDDVELGIMIETPAAAVISDRLAALVDFFSIGTNDLTQYTLAVDRQNPALEGSYDTHHEAVLRLIEYTIKQAKARGIWVGICGELGADETLCERFLCMGVDEISVTPPAVLPLRRRVCSLRLHATDGARGDGAVTEKEYL